MTKAITTALALLLATVVAREFTARALAATCASAPVSARGEESRYVWLAKSKTQANWRAKVRAISGLGPDYASWARAEDTEERCLSGPNGTVCTFTGTPCRR